LYLLYHFTILLDCYTSRRNSSGFSVTARMNRYGRLLRCISYLFKLLKHVDRNSNLNGGRPSVAIFPSTPESCVARQSGAQST
jgi:hypothetical protein